MNMRVALNELLPAKTASRELPQALDRLERGEVEQLVITKRNEPRAVVVSVERYEQLLGSEGAQHTANGNGSNGSASGADAAAHEAPATR
jgi:prevent-host-death family protein